MEEQNMQQQPASGKNGPLVAIIIIVIIIVVGGIYFWSSGDRVPSPVDELPENPADDLQVQELSDVSESDEIEDIEADLEADFEDLDAEFEEIDALLAE